MPHAPAVRVAENVAAHHQPTGSTAGEIIEGTRQAGFAPGDVLVLVRKRDRFVHALSRSLEGRDIPVAGADRLSLPGHIAVKDLIALGRIPDPAARTICRLPPCCAARSSAFGRDAFRACRQAGLPAFR